MNPETINREQVIWLLTEGKCTCPDRFPKPDPAVVDAWHRILATRAPIPDMWPQALQTWIAEIAPTTSGMCGPGDLIATLKTVTARWESDPKKRAELHRWRELRQQRRDEEIFRLEQRRQAELPAPPGKNSDAEQGTRGLATAGDILTGIQQHLTRNQAPAHNTPKNEP